MNVHGHPTPALAVLTARQVEIRRTQAEYELPQTYNPPNRQPQCGATGQGGRRIAGKVKGNERRKRTRLGEGVRAKEPRFRQTHTSLER